MEKSKQPYFVFSNDEKEQTEQLKTNSLMLQFEKYREENKNDLVNPSYHFWSPDGRINDPNGLCFWKGKYHLFYQQYPTAYPRQHWGHAVSEDMVHWRDLPTALYPDIEKACFSGNTLVENDRVIAMYHGWGVGNMIATSSDPLLLNWEKNPNNPVIPNLPFLQNQKSPYSPTDWKTGLPYRIYDPFIWKDDDGYYSLSGVQSGGIMKEYLFYSENLDSWKHIGELIEENHFVESPNDGACPYFLPFGKKEDTRILLFFSHSSGSRALVGKYDKATHKFLPTKSVKFSSESVAVSSLVAPCAISDGDGGVYVIYNMGESLSNRNRRGVLSLMRHITCGDDGELLVEPARQNDSLRRALLLEESFPLEAFEKKQLDVRGKCLEINAQIDIKSARGVEFCVLSDDGGREYTTVSVTSGRNGGTPCGYITVDTSHSSLYPDVIGRIPDSTRFSWDGKEKINIRIYVDKCMVEVFVNGKAALCQMAYASLKESDGISVQALGACVSVESIKIYNMDTIY